MDNDQNKVYQYPTTSNGESFDAQNPIDTELSQTEVDQQFYSIAHKEVLLAFNEMTRNLHLAADGNEVEQTRPVEIFTPDPDIAELLQVGNGLIEGRAQHIEGETMLSFIERIFGRKNS